MPSNYFSGFGAKMVGFFGEEKSAVFHPVSGQHQTIEVIFNSAHREIDVDGKPYGSPKPVAWVKNGLISPSFNDVLEVDGKRYLIKDDKPDGLELMELLLAEEIQ